MLIATKYFLLVNTKQSMCDSRVRYSDCEDFLPLLAGEQVYICKVYDGDTFTAAWQDARMPGTYVRHTCRLRGVDTPELRRCTSAERELGLCAKARLEKAILHRDASILQPGKEKWGRLLCDLQTVEHPSVKDYMLQDTRICRPYLGGKKSAWIK